MYVCHIHMLCLYIYIYAALYTNSHISIFLQMFNHFAALYFRSTYVTLLDSTPLRSALALPENCRACDTDSLDLCKTQSQHAAHTVAHSALHKYTHSRLPFSQSQSEFASSPVRPPSLSPSLARSVALCLCRTFRLEQYGLCLWLCLCPGYGSSSSSSSGTGSASASDFRAGSDSDWVCLGVCLWRCLLPLSIVDCGLDCGRSIVDVDCCCCCCCYCCRCVLGPPPSGRAARWSQFKLMIFSTLDL